MPDEILIENVKESLRLLLQTGESQLSQIKNKFNKPVRFDKSRRFIELDGIILPTSHGLSRLMTEPSTLLRQNIESFWFLFSNLTEDIESPLSNFAVRPVLELALSRVVHFASRTALEQKEIAVKYWLCTNALLINAHELSKQGLNRREAYESGLDLLADGKSRAEFVRLRDDGFPFHDVHKKLHNLGGKLLDPKVAEDVRKISVNLLGADSNFKWDIMKIYRSLSMYEHGNPTILWNQKRERGDKTHVTRCAKALLVVGEIMIAFTDKHFDLDAPVRKDLLNKLRRTGEELLKEWEARTQKKIGS